MRPSIDEREAVRLRDLLTHRGPDGAGLWVHHNVILAHRRLAVVDLSETGAQPMFLEPGGVVSTRAEPGAPARLAMVYNGELYNDAELRRELEGMGVRFRGTCDAETVLQALAVWGTAGLARLRGMFAIALYDAQRQTLLLARDALGIKPLYFAQSGPEVVFASEPGSILAHPRISRRPNLEMVSAYLTTIRTVLGNATLFEGVHALAPGKMAEVLLAGPEPVVRVSTWWQSARSAGDGPGLEEAAEMVGGAVRDSVVRHLRADVPTCALLSGGLDSSIVAGVAAPVHGSLRTYCAGTQLPADCREEREQSDLVWARRVAAALGTQHAEAHVTREMFLERWRWMVGRQGVPLSTPNEVAIHAVAQRLREDGCIVTLSGEGADELFAGYEGPMRSAWAYVHSDPGERSAAPGPFELRASAWIAPEIKSGVLRPDVWSALLNDAALDHAYDAEFAVAAEEAGDDGLAAHLRLYRRINLTGLLQRLDTATMLAGVEGRTPLADAEIAALAESLPMGLKFDYGDSPGGGGAAGTEMATGGVLTASGVAVAPARTKIVLREAFRGVVLPGVVNRPKASFPLPFRGWMDGMSGVLRGSSFARSVFTDAAVEAVAAQPEKRWNLAWPMMNLAVWGDAMGW